MTSTVAGPAAAVTTDRIWQKLNRANFAVVSYATPGGDPRCTGVLYLSMGRRLFVVVGEDSWKARHIAASGRVAVTVPVRRGGVMALLLPIPPATISFHGSALVHDPQSPAARTVVQALGGRIPPQRRAACRIVEIRPEDRFLTYGIGIPLAQMRDPSRAQARVSVA
jgi:hypothetical protein